MKTRTPEDHLRDMVGEMFLQMAVLRSRVEELEAQLAAVPPKDTSDAKDDPAKSV